MAKHPFLKIRFSPEGVLQLSGKHIQHHGIDGEIPPPGRFPQPKIRIYKHIEVPVPSAPGLLSSWHGDVDVVSPKHVDPERFAHRDPFTDLVQNPFQFCWLQAMDLHVQILHRLPAQSIPYASAHVETPASGFCHQCCDPLYCLTFMTFDLHRYTFSFRSL